MSYCRFSDLDWTSDVYAYEDVSGGYTVHVAAYRRVFGSELPPAVSVERCGIAAWVQRQLEVARLARGAARERIGLPLDGKSFCCLGLEGAIARLSALRDMGYRVPRHAFDALEDEKSGLAYQAKPGG